MLDDGTKAKADDVGIADTTAVEPPAPLVAAGVMLVAKDTGLVLFGLRSDSGLWAFPGGRLEEGESIAECAIREFAEETGIDLATDDLTFLTRRIGDGVDFTTFTATLPTAVVPVLDHEHAGFAWMSGAAAMMILSAPPDTAEAGPADVAEPQDVLAADSNEAAAPEGTTAPADAAEAA